MPRSNRKPAATKLSDEDRWLAIAARDAAADGQFYYSVASTGVYCRPSCGARRPLRKNVSFHASCAAAEAAGFRPCKRCKPRDSDPRRAQADKVAAACRTIEAAETPPSLDALADGAGMSRYHFHRVFKAVTGLTPKAYAAAHRNDKVRAALHGSASVTDAVYAAGFASSARFYEAADGVLGMKPRAYRSGGKDMQIRYATAPSSLGLVIVGATAKGVCAIFLGDDEATLVQELRNRFPQSSLSPADADFNKLLDLVIANIEMPHKADALPLDIRGTAFQQRVWTALREIPAGETATYADIARRVGKPNAVRAVGTACGANPIAVAVPCHRVVGSDGKLTGYRWGVERKRALLAREGK